MKFFFLLLTLTVVFSSCEKVLDLDLDTSDPTLVVEANITNQVGPYFVKLTKTVAFDQSSVYPAVSDALVIISDNTGIVDTLNHTGNGVYATKKLQGIEGRTYTLSIESEGKSFTATSTLPELIALDSLRITSFDFAGESQKVLIPVYNDPSQLGNNYNFKLIVNDTLDKSYILWNDNTNNGVPNERPLRSNEGNFKSGDVVDLEMQCIDLSAYNYYFTLSQIAGNGPGGGTTPANPPNNISGGALGLFSAHTSQKKTIIIP
jgi:hypothetical protein